eukprot:403360019
MFGTVVEESIVTVLDFSANGDLVIGGKTSNTDFLPSLASSKPFISAIDNTHTFKFAKVLNPSSNIVFTSVKYSYNQKLIIGQLDTQTQYTLVFLNSTNGNLVKVLRSSDSFSPLSLLTELITDSVGNLWYSYTNNGQIPLIFGFNYVNLTAPSLPHFMQSKWNDGNAIIHKLRDYKHINGSHLIMFTFHQTTTTPQNGGFVAINSSVGSIVFGKQIIGNQPTSDLDTYYNVGSNHYSIFTCASRYVPDGELRYTRHTIQVGGTDSNLQFVAGNAASYFQCGGLQASNDTYFVGFFKSITGINDINYFTAKITGTSLNLMFKILSQMSSINFSNQFYATYILDEFNSYYVGGTQKYSNTSTDYPFRQGFVMSNIYENTCYPSSIPPQSFNFAEATVTFSSITSSQITTISQTISVNTDVNLVSLNLTSNIVKHCSEVSTVFNSIPDIAQSYTIGTILQQFSVPAFELSSTKCKDVTYQNEALVVMKKGVTLNPPEKLPPFIFYEKDVKYFRIQTDEFSDFYEYDPIQIRIFASIKESATISGVLIVNLDLVKATCPAPGSLTISFDSLTKQEIITYYVYSGVKEYKFSNFTYNTKTCEVIRNVLNQNMTTNSNPGITYNYLINSSFIFIDTDQYTSDTEIKVKLKIEYTGTTVNDFLDLTIRIAVRPNEKFLSLINSGPPTFQTQINDIQINVDQELNYIFPVVTDPDKDNYSMKIECGGAIKFTEISSSGLILKPKQDDIGKYQCKVTMSDDHKYQKSSTTIINIIVGSSINEQLKVELSNNIIRNNTSTLLKAIIQKITKYGEVFVKFNREIKKPHSCQVIDMNSLLLIIEPAETSDIKMLDFSWKVTDCTSKQLVIQLYFENPLYVSIQERDRLNIIFMRNGLFKDASTLQPIRLQYTCSDSIPNQLDKNSKKYCIDRYFFRSSVYKQRTTGVCQRCYISYVDKQFCDKSHNVIITSILNILGLSPYHIYGE